MGGGEYASPVSDRYAAGSDEVPVGQHPIYIVDVFAEERYAGNPLAVVTGAGDLESHTMQRIARETNFSETTFVTHEAPRDGAWDVRIFTPQAEIPFAGHPTLGTAWVLRHELARGAGAHVVLRLGVGEVAVRFGEEAGRELLWMRAPTPSLGPVHAREPVAELLDLVPEELDPRLPVQEVSAGLDFTFVPVRSLASLARARVRVDRLERAEKLDFPPFFYLVCAESHPSGGDLAVRFFAPTVGVPEDPATGSACACLGAYLLEHRVLGRGAVDVRVAQGEAIGRPSLLWLRAERGEGTSRIDVGGRVVPTVRGELA
jgi:trans-2,3-dihydro-3-hydroxyanthranilate isomerase